MDWIKKHVDTSIILGAILSAVFWMNSSIGSLERELHSEISSVRSDIANVEREVAIIKTVLIMHKIMPCELAKEVKE